jgi:non-heme chloroperoxidase
MVFLASHGYRSIAHDRRGHGRWSQPWAGNDMDTSADDLATLIETLDLKRAILVGFSAGGGEVARYIGRHGTKRVVKAALISAVPPLMLKTAANPGGLPMKIFDEIRAGSVAGRLQLYKDLASGPFFGFNRPGAKISQGMIDWFWFQGMQAAIKTRLTASRRSPRPTSPRTSRNSTCRPSSYTATTTRSCRSAPLLSPRRNSSITQLSRSMQAHHMA